MGRYAVLMEYPNTEAFTRLWPLAPGPATETVQQLGKEYSALFDKYSSIVGNFVPTDYVEVSK